METIASSFPFLLKMGYHFLCICISSIVLPIFLLIYSVLYLVRQVIATYLSYHQKGRFKLMLPLDAMWSLYPANSSIKFSACFYVRSDINQFNLADLRKRISQDAAFSRGPYKKLQYRICAKFGFPCWEDMSIGGKFNINDHVKIFPDLSEKILKENEVLNIVNKYVNSKLGSAENIPDWEMLVIPQVQMWSDHSNQNETYVVLILQVNHGYMDGNCAVRFVQTCVMDREDSTQLSSVITMNQRGNKQTPIIQKLRHQSRLLLYGPMYVVEALFRNKQFKFLTTNHQSKAERQMFLARSKYQISNSALNRIRVAYGCQSMSIVTSAFLSALNNVAEQKGLKTPHALKVGFTHALLPYPTEEPQNSFCIIVKCLPLSGPNERQIMEIDRLTKVVKKNEHEVDSVFWLLTMIGRFPLPMLRIARRSLTTFTCAVSGIPATETLWKFQNGVVEAFFSFPPLVDGVDYICGYHNYGGNLNSYFYMKSTCVLEDHADLDEFTMEFDECLQKLEREANKMLIGKQIFSPNAN